MGVRRQDKGPLLWRGGIQFATRQGTDQSQSRSIGRDSEDLRRSGNGIDQGRCRGDDIERARRDLRASGTDGFPMNTGAHHALSMADYLKLPAVGSTQITDIVDKCPAAAWASSWLNPNRVLETTDESDRGTIAHAMLLEGDHSGVQVIDPNDHPAEKTGAIPDGWTNKSIKAAREAAREAGKIPVLKTKMVEIEDMVKVARTFIAGLQKTEPAIWRMFQPGGGTPEMTMLWEDGGTLCRIRPDRIAIDSTIVVNYKTTSGSVEPDRWGRSQLLDYYVGAAFYVRGIDALYGVRPEYVYLCQEANPPYLCSLVGLNPQWLELGMAKVKIGLRKWQQCIASGEWPGYPSRIAYPDVPPWELMRFEEKQL